MIDLITASSYYRALICNPDIYLNTLQTFWRTATEVKEGNKVIGVSATFGKRQVTITPTSISNALMLDDLQGEEKFDQGLMNAEFIERGYEGQTNKGTLDKKKCAPSLKFLFHTLMVCCSGKRGTWNEVPKNTQYLAYAILTNQKFKLSSVIFTDIKNNLKTADKLQRFLLYPRFIMQCIYQALDEATYEQGVKLKINQLKLQTFTRMDVKPELDFEEQLVAPHIEPLVEPTAPADQGRQHQSPEEPTAVLPKRPKTKSKASP
jgi:uncharacterized metal-binding protein